MSTELRHRSLAGMAWALVQRVVRRHHRDISDEYTEWLSYVNAGWLNRGNLYCFDYALRHIPAGSSMIEIGSFCGLSTNLLTYYKRKHGLHTPLFTCDRWLFNDWPDTRQLGSAPIQFGDYRAFVKETFKRNVELFSAGDLPYSIELWSDEFFRAWRANVMVQDVFGRTIQLGGPVGFAYIDGDHSYAGVQRDFSDCDALLVPGGFVLFDDSSDFAPWPAVRRFVREVRRSGRYELVCRNPNYLFRKR